MLSKFLLGENFFMKIAAINQNLLFSHFNSTNDIVLHRAKKDIMFKTFHNPSTSTLHFNDLVHCNKLQFTITFPRM